MFSTFGFLKSHVPSKEKSQVTTKEVQKPVLSSANGGLIVKNEKCVKCASEQTISFYCMSPCNHLFCYNCFIECDTIICYCPDCPKKYHTLCCICCGKL